MKSEPEAEGEESKNSNDELPEVFKNIPSVFNEKPMFLSENKFEKIILSSYPRSGNTLVRKYLEEISEVLTGSDCDVRRKLNYDLIEMGMEGEGLVDHLVWCIKTHYPERFGASRFLANKCILLVRNPLDCITSLFNMIATGTHNNSISDHDYVKFRHHWVKFIE